jgi:hypothetical protein
MLVNRVTIHHEGAGSPTDNVSRYKSARYSAGIGINKYELWRDPAQSFVTKGQDRRCLQVCLSGNRDNYPVSTSDINLIDACCDEARDKGYLTDVPEVFFHNDTMATGCPGNYTEQVRADITNAIRGGAAPPLPIEFPERTDMVGFASTPDGGGYWQCGPDGGVFCFGNAGFFGSMGGKPLSHPVVDMAATPDGQGYALAAADGGVFAFGNVGFEGSMGGQKLNSPVCGIEIDPDGTGYWLVAEDGGVFAFKAPFHGSAAGQITPWRSP